MKFIVWSQSPDMSDEAWFAHDRQRHVHDYYGAATMLNDIYYWSAWSGERWESGTSDSMQESKDKIELIILKSGELKFLSQAKLNLL